MAFEQGESSSGKVMVNLILFFSYPKTFFFEICWGKSFLKFYTGNEIRLSSSNRVLKIIFPDLVLFEHFESSFLFSSIPRFVRSAHLVYFFLSTPPTIHLGFTFNSLVLSLQLRLQ